MTISVPSPDPGVPTSLIDAACSRWNNSCPEAGSSFPLLYAGYGGDISVEVVHIHSSPGRFCGEFMAELGPGQTITGATISLYDVATDGFNCEAVRERTLAHELGHVLGLDDTACSEYSSYLMGPRVGGGGYPNPDECLAADLYWYTFTEQQQVAKWSCEQYCQGTCEPDWNGQWECHDGQPSPIIVDLGGDGYHLTSLADGVSFDVYGDGTPRRTSWTSDGDEALLCFDLDHDGRITSGRELFGNYTILHGGTQAENGFVALGWYDRPEMGGNADGWIDPGDVIWGLLRVWRDTNHDGISQPSELISLDAAGVVGISTNYKEGGRRDAAGNRFRNRGIVLIRDANGRVHRRPIYDIYLVTDV